MAEIADTLCETIPRAMDSERELRLIEGDCAWTHGDWVLAAGNRRRWNELQNTPKDIKFLNDYLGRVDRDHRRTAAKSAA